MTVALSRLNSKQFESALLRTLSTLLALLFLKSTAFAQSLPPSVIEMGGRYFDLRADVSGLRREAYFIPLAEVEWLGNVKEVDPNLDPTTIYVRAMLDPRERLTWPADHPEYTGALKYPLTENIPKEFVLEGMHTRSAHPSNRALLLVPIDTPDVFFVRCTGGEITINAFCNVVAKYPPNDRYYLVARVYHVTPPVNDFRAIAERMLEIALCLDVTEEFLAGDYQPLPYVDPEGPLPDLKDCRDGLS